jgi:hypothetical protein
MGKMTLASSLKKTPVLIYGMGVIGKKTLEVLQKQEGGGAVLAFLDRNAHPEQMLHALPVMTPKAWLAENNPTGVTLVIAILNEDFLPHLPILKSELSALGFAKILDMQDLPCLWPEVAKEVTDFYHWVQSWNAQYFEKSMQLFLAGEFSALTQFYPIFQDFERHKYCSHEFWLILAASLFLCDEKEKSRLVLSRYIEQHGIKDIYRYAPLSLCMDEDKVLAADESIAMSAFVAKKLGENQTHLASLFDGKTIAVVGNGPSELGKGLGELIDAHDMVIRFNNFSTQGFATDYGCRTDIWARNLRADIEDKSSHVPFEAIILAHDLMGYRIPDKSVLDLLFRDLQHSFQQVSSIPHAVYRAFISEAHMTGWESPTVGALIVYYLLKYSNAKKIDCYGFSFFETPSADGFLPHYFNDHETRDLSEIQKFHNHRKETGFLRSLLGGREDASMVVRNDFKT